MSDKPMAAEVTETTSPRDAMMYWHERAMQAETERDDAIQKHALCLAVATRSTARIAELEAKLRAATTWDGTERRCEQSKDMLRKIESALREGREIRATTDGGWPRCGLHPVVNVGMYDGWPYWKPVPSVQTLGPLGCEWNCFSMITEIQETAP